MVLKNDLHRDFFKARGVKLKVFQESISVFNVGRPGTVSEKGDIDKFPLMNCAFFEDSDPNVQ